MKLALILALSLFACGKKSDDAKPAEPAANAPAGSAEPAGSGDPHAMGHRGRMMKDMDTDGDGKISDAEREAFRKKRLEKAREKLDANHDGKLTVDELKAAGGRMKFDNAEALDTNKDGDISVDELDAAMKERRAAKMGSAGSAAPAGSGEEPAE